MSARFRSLLIILVAAATGVLPVGAAESKSASRPSIQLQNATTEKVLSLYAEITSRSVLHPELPRASFTLNATPTNQADFALLFEKAFAEKGIVTIPDGEKFVLVVPKTLAASAMPRSSEIKSLAQRFPNLDAQPTASVNLSAADLKQLLDLYAGTVKRKVAEIDQTLPVAHFSFRSQAPLTGAEVIYALDTLLGWQHLMVVPAGDDSIKVVRLKPGSPIGK